MKKLMLAVGLLTGLVLSGSAQNLLQNPSFETLDGRNPNLPDKWNTHQVLSLGKHHSIDSSIAMDGKNSAKITNDNPAMNDKSYILWMQPGLADALNKDNVPDTPMEFSVYARIDAPETRFRIYFETTNAGYTFISPIQEIPVGEWTQVKIKFLMPRNKFTNAYVCLQLTSNGTVWFDNAYLGKADSAPREVLPVVPSSDNRIVNPSIETLGKDGKNAISWTPYQVNIKGDFHSVDKAVAHSGINSLKIICEDPAMNDNNFVMFRQANLQKRLADCPSGTPLELSVWANTNSNPAVTFRVYVEMLANGRFLGTFISPTQSVYAGWGRVAVKFNMPRETPDNVYVALQLLTPGTVYFDDIYLWKAPAAPVVVVETPLLLKDYYVRVSDFPPQQTYYLPQVPKTLKLAAKLPEGQAVKASLSTIAGKLIKSYGEVKNSIEVPPLEAGSYLLQYEAGDIKDEDVFRIVKPSEKGVKFSTDHRMTLNNKPFFPIMIITPAMSSEALKIYGEMGFNSIAFTNLTANAVAAKYLAETADKYGMATVAWSDFGDRSGLSDAETTQKLDAEIQVARSLPNFIGWLDDESEWREIPLKSMRRYYHKLFSDAPEFAVWQNHAPRFTDAEKVLGSAVNVRRYTRLSDVISCDIYPVPEEHGHNNLPNKTISCVGEYTDLVMASGFGQKPVWMILQAMGWSEEGGQPLDAKNPRPDYRQLRFMTYNAVTHGATGIVFYGPAGFKDIYSPLMTILSDVLKELTAITPFLLGGDQVKVEFSADPEVRVKIFRVQEDYLIIAVNESKKSVSFKLAPPVANRKFYQLPSGQVFTLPDITLDANEVKIISTRLLVIPQTPVFKAETIVSKDKRAGSLGKMSWTAQWVAHPKFFRTDNKTTFAKQSFNLTEVPAKFEIRVTGDDNWKFAVNGQTVGSGSGHTIVQQFDISKYLKKGENELTFKLYNIAGPSGILYEGEADIGGQNLKLASGKNTFFSENCKSDWVAPYLAGTPPVLPWGELTVLVKAN